MKKLLGTFSVTLLLVVAVAGKGSCAEVVGTVSNLGGGLISGAVVTAKDSSGKLFGQAVTDSQGHYDLSGLALGQYQYFLQVSQLGFKDGSAVAALGPKGLTMDWKVSNQNPAVAMATEGTNISTALAGDPFGLTWAQFAGLAAVPIVAGGVIGGYAAAGGFSGSNGPTHHAASPGL